MVTPNLLKSLRGSSDLKWAKNLDFNMLYFVSDVADDYIHISATLNSLSVDDNTALKKWVTIWIHYSLRYTNGAVVSSSQLRVA